jgi:Tat protein translocase TatB subunit
MNLGFPEMLFLFVLALLIFGPKKLPEIGRQVGKAMSEFKRASNEFKAQLDSEIRHLELEETGRRLYPEEQAELIPASPEGAVSTTADYAGTEPTVDNTVVEGSPANSALNAVDTRKATSIEAATKDV